MKTFKHLISRIDKDAFVICILISILSIILGQIGNFIVKDKFPILIVFQLLSFTLMCISLLSMIQINREWNSIIKNIRNAKIIYKMIREQNFKRSENNKFIIPAVAASLEVMLMWFLYYNIGINYLLIALSCIVIWFVAFISYLACNQYFLFCTLAKYDYSNKHTNSNLYNTVYNFNVIKDRLLFGAISILLNVLIIFVPFLYKCNVMITLEKNFLGISKLLIEFFEFRITTQFLCEILVCCLCSGIFLLLFACYVFCFFKITKHANKFNKRFAISV